MSSSKLPPANDLPADSWPEGAPLPVETEIYILPSGEVVVADLPAELAPLLAALTDRPAPGSAEQKPA
ncbi:MAG TPA: hypothetical protein VNK95_18145 [Caldilineaceae bacterium]|nr:hypothetical protein [Caldilineaceae bacterium]